MVAQAGTSAADVNRTMRCPPPHCARRPTKPKQWKKPRKPPPGSVHPLARKVPLPQPRPEPEMDEDQRAAYRVIAELLAAGKIYVKPLSDPAPRQTLLGGLAREIGKAFPPTLGGYLDSLVRPIGNCREFESLDGRVKQIVADAARHFGGTALMTSCYRSAAYNRRVYARMGRRPTKSLHIARKAVDFKIAGVSKFEVAKYVRKHKLAGGVGLYCNSVVHVDVGRRRSWNWCARRRATA